MDKIVRMQMDILIETNFRGFAPFELRWQQNTQCEPAVLTETLASLFGERLTP